MRPITSLRRRLPSPVSATLTLMLTVLLTLTAPLQVLAEAEFQRSTTPVNEGVGPRSLLTGLTPFESMMSMAADAGVLGERDKTSALPVPALAAVLAACVMGALVNVVWDIGLGWIRGNSPTGLELAISGLLGCGISIAALFFWAAVVPAKAAQLAGSDVLIKSVANLLGRHAPKAVAKLAVNVTTADIVKELVSEGAGEFLEFCIMEWLGLDLPSTIADFATSLGNDPSASDVRSAITGGFGASLDGTINAGLAEIEAEASVDITVIDHPHALADYSSSPALLDNYIETNLLGLNPSPDGQGYRRFVTRGFSTQTGYVSITTLPEAADLRLVHRSAGGTASVSVWVNGTLAGQGIQVTALDTLTLPIGQFLKVGPNAVRLALDNASPDLYDLRLLEVFMTGGKISQVTQQPPQLQVDKPNVLPGEDFTLSWTPVVGASLYYLETSNSPTAWGGFSAIPLSQTSLTLNIPSLALTTRYYRVKADNTTYSNVVDVTSAPPPGQGDLVPNPRILSSSGALGGVSNDQSISVTINGVSHFNWSASAILPSGMPRWLTVLNSQGTEADPIRVRADPAKVTSAGPYAGTIRITSTAANAPVDVPVTFQVISGGQSGIDLVIDTAWIDYAYHDPRVPGAPRNQIRYFWRTKNIGTNTLAAVTTSSAAAGDTPWWSDSPFPASFRLPNADNLQGELLNYNRSLPPGGTITEFETDQLPAAAYAIGQNYLIFVTDSDWDSGNVFCEVGVVAETNECNNYYIVPFYIPRPPTLALIPSAVSMSLEAGEVGSAVIVVSNQGDQALQWTATSPAAGVTVTPSATSFLVQADARILGAGSHAISIPVTSNATNGTVNLPVSVTVATAPVIQAALGTDSVRTAQPSSTTLTLANAGGSTLSWSLLEGAGWLSLSTAAGSGAGAVTVTFDPTGLVPGVYRDSIIVTAPNATNSPYVLRLTLDVPVPPAQVLLAPDVVQLSQRTGDAPVQATAQVLNGGGGVLGGLVVSEVVYLTATPMNWLSAGLGQAVAPAVLTLQADGSSLSPGPYQALAIVAGAGGSADTVAVTLQVVPPLVAGGPGMLPPGVVGRAVAPVDFTATGGTPPYQWDAPTGLPPGLSLDPATGRLSGIPAAPFSGLVMIESRDAGQPAQADTVTVAFTAVGPVLIGGPGSLPGGVVGRPFGPVSFNAAGGLAPVAWQALTGLPAGLSLDPATGTLSGQPTLPSSGVLEVEVRDASQPAQADTVTLPWEVVGPVVITAPAGLAPMVAGRVIAPVALAATGGAAPLGWMALAGMPAGLSLDPGTGVLSGTPAAAGTGALSVEVRDASQPAQADTVLLPWQVAGPVSIGGPGSLPVGIVGRPYPGATYQATGGLAPLAWTALGGVPPGLVLDPGTGVLSGIPSAGGAGTLTVEVRDGSQPAQADTLALPWLVAGPVVATDPGSLPRGVIGRVYGPVPLTATGGLAPRAWQVLGGLPPGLTLDPGTGVLGGIPTAAGAGILVAEVRDAAQPAQADTLTLPWDVVGAVGITGPAALPPGVVGRAYGPVSYTAAGGAAPWQWAVVAGLPAGLTLDPATGVLQGIPSAAGSGQLVVRVQDGSAPAQADTSSLAWMMAGPVVIDPPAPLPTLVVGRSLAPTPLTASGGLAPRTWRVVSGLPAGLALSSAGVLQGTSTSAGGGTLVAEVSDASQPAQTATVALPWIVVGPVVTTGPAALPKGVVGRAFGPVSYGASGGSLPYQWVVLSGLPPGLALNPATGVLDGTPTSAGTGSLVVEVQDANQPAQVDTLALPWEIVGPVAITGPASLPQGIRGRALGPVSFTAAGGLGPYQWSVASGLAPGLTLDPATGVLAGVPGTAGSGTLVVEVRDASQPAQADTVSLPWAVAGPVVISGPATLPKATAGQAYGPVSFQAGGGVAPLAWSALSGLPAGLTLDGTSGALTGTPTAAGSGTLVVEVRDAAQPFQADTVQLALVVDPACPAVTAALIGRIVDELFGTATLSATERGCVDADGNKDGGVDVGDLVALLDQHPGLSLPASLRREITKLVGPDQGREQR